MEVKSQISLQSLPMKRLICFCSLVAFLGSAHSGPVRTSRARAQATHAKTAKRKSGSRTVSKPLFRITRKPLPIKGVKPLPRKTRKALPRRVKPLSHPRRGNAPVAVVGLLGVAGGGVVFFGSLMSGSVVGLGFGAVGLGLGALLIASAENQRRD